MLTSSPSFSKRPESVSEKTRGYVSIGWFESVVSLVTVAVLNVKAVSVKPTSVNGKNKSSPYEPIS